MTPHPNTPHRARGGSARPAWLVRLALAVIAVRQAVAGGHELVGCIHPWADVACWQLAVSVGLLTVATRPGAAEALLPLLTAAGVLTAVVSVRDIAEGTTTPTRETSHLWFEFGLAMVITLWTLLQSEPGPATATFGPTPHPGRLGTRPDGGLVPTAHPSTRHR
ncbi:MAG TPA: hypothetical protein VHV82_03280 [Sporichthyaceae bacterium]|nr:hypothetical protein [Sporichthyaceae bacterium]